MSVVSRPLHTGICLVLEVRAVQSRDVVAVLASSGLGVTLSTLARGRLRSVTPLQVETKRQTIVIRTSSPSSNLSAYTSFLLHAHKLVRRGHPDIVRIAVPTSSQLSCSLSRTTGRLV